jgi:hypothetical protein
MFHVQVPVAPLDVGARARVYREYVQRHIDELTDVNLGPHNDMILLAVDAASHAKAAVLVATGEQGAVVQFPLHLHGAGEIQVCLEGHYGELLPLDQPVDDIFEWGTTLAEFQAQYPDVVTLGEKTAEGQMIVLGPGACWNFVAGSQHAPCGWIGPSGYLLAQIYWPGPNEVPPGATPG